MKQKCLFIMLQNCIASLTIVWLLCLVVLPRGINAQDSYEGYYNYLGTYPADANPGWHVNVQGITHDDADWYITDTTSAWRIPVSADLADDASDNPLVTIINYEDIPDLYNNDLDHFGDPEWYRDKDNGKGYLLIPVGRSPGTDFLAIFETLYDGSRGITYIGKAELAPFEGVWWVAVDPEGYVWISDSTGEGIYKYYVDWAQLQNNPPQVIVNRIDSKQLCDGNGNPLFGLYDYQGGVFSESGDLLYITIGNTPNPNDGINVFDTTTWRRVARSTKGGSFFNFDFDPTIWCVTEACPEEPEGLTIWDMDKVPNKHPSLTGQLHVLLLDNDFPSDDEIHLKHYTQSVYVNHAVVSSGNGTPASPYKTVTEAWMHSWNGMQIKIRTGSYPESLTLEKRMKVLSEGGTVIIGR